ncbi:hypothetical protein J8F10_17065 [Gemmata sp. G18]|uniref:TIGR03067 domain-containing protein n=1 Tax=Gemmata palustris TaxID=2822762 RepID=A0ABS5BU74_9BACT|nr:hypothetical protein [Gemmata palustris]MBP3956982.1 hypothetical protein [Gemmata palustris]
MKVLLTAVLALGLAGFAKAEDKAGPVGTWKCETDIMGQKRESTLTIKKDGDKFAGTVVGPDKKELKLDGVKFKDGELTFSVEREREGTKFTVKYKLKVEKDAVKGKAEAEFGGETRSFDVEGKREKKDK